VTGDDEPTQLEGVGDRLDVRHPVEDAALFVGGRAADSRSVGGDESDAERGCDRSSGYLHRRESPVPC
jgi:hypothetical protein